MFRCALILIFVIAGIAPLSVAADDLAKKSQNPGGDIISLPIEYWHYDGMANDSSADAFGNVEKPDGGPEWSMMFSMKFLFPKS